jgi:hypothetical protein
MESVNVLERPKAAEYGEMIGEQLLELDRIVSEYGDEVTTDELKSLAESFRDDDDEISALDCESAALFLDDLGIGDDSYGPRVWDRWIGQQLSARVSADRFLSESEWDCQRVTVLVTYGGPTCVVWADSGAGIVVECWWGSDHWQRRFSDLTDLGSILWEMAEYE